MSDFDLYYNMLEEHPYLFGLSQLENLEADQQEISQALAVIARQNNMTVEQLKPMYDAEFEKAVIKSVLTGKVMRLIRDAAEVTVV